jgi:type IV pilus assembly protein PilB
MREMGLVTEEQIRAALGLKAKEGLRIGEALVKLGFVTEEEVLQSLGEQFAIPVVDIKQTRISPDAVAALSRTDARRHNVFPIDRSNGVLTVAIADPLDLHTLDNVRFISGSEVRPVLATRESIREAIDRFYKEDMSKIIETQEETAQVETTQAAVSDEEAPIIRLVHVLIQDAVKARASDIHVEPMANKLRIRYRIDGYCKEIESPPKRLQGPVISRIKIMAGIDIAEKRRPTDGRITMKAAGKDLDLRVSCLPATHGESVVLRLLEKESVLMNLQDLGFDPADYKRFQAIIRRPNGIFLVTGPTGSGKTTTLYAALNELNRPDRKIITAENPVEYHMKGVNQCHVNERAGLTFALILRAMLRQAPNIILVGEIRDRETAEIAIQAALTGHLVFSTLHTNDAPSAITRLIDMGVPPFLVASSVQAVMAQRLVRKICPKCKQPFQYDRKDLMAIGLKPDEISALTLYKGAGCTFCQNVTYRGRMGIFEVMEMNRTLQEMAFHRSPSRALRRQARLSGMTTLQEDGARKVLAGMTTVEEVLTTTEREEALT